MHLVTKCYRVIDGICFYFACCCLSVWYLYLLCLLSQFQKEEEEEEKKHTKQIHLIQAIIILVLPYFLPHFSVIHSFIFILFFSFSWRFGVRLLYSILRVVYLQKWHHFLFLHSVAVDSTGFSYTKLEKN